MVVTRRRDLIEQIFADDASEYEVYASEAMVPMIGSDRDPCSCSLARPNDEAAIGDANVPWRADANHECLVVLGALIKNDEFGLMAHQVDRKARKAPSVGIKVDLSPGVTLICCQRQTRTSDGGVHGCPFRWCRLQSWVTAFSLAARMPPNESKAEI